MRHLSLFAAALAAALAAGCASAPPPVRGLRLELEETQLGPRPWVHLTVAGEPYRLLLDTGAQQHLLPAAFAKAHRLSRRGGGYDAFMIDSNGRRTKVSQLANVPVRFEGTAAPVLLDFTENPEASSTEGLLVPQTLMGRGWAMHVDLERRELSFLPEAEVSPRSTRLGPWRPVPFHRCATDDPFDQGHRVVTVLVNGIPAEMLLDTGANTTALARNNPALPSMAGRAGQRARNAGVASVGDLLILDDVPISLGGMSVTTSVSVLPASHSCFTGAIGTDLLRHCEMLWGESTMWLACRAPEAPAAARP
jgi:predicted aspartyl protease